MLQWQGNVGASFSIPSFACFADSLEEAENYIKAAFVPVQLHHVLLCLCKDLEHVLGGLTILQGGAFRAATGHLGTAHLHGAYYTLSLAQMYGTAERELYPAQEGFAPAVPMTPQAAPLDIGKPFAFSGTS